jgi:hypothetical protein
MLSLDEMKSTLNVLKDKRDRALRDLAVAENQLALSQKALKEEFGVETVEDGQAMLTVLQNKIEGVQTQWDNLMEQIQQKVTLAES